MTKAKKILALVLCLAMCVSLFTGFAMAEEKALKLVCLGDSTSNGFGLNDYGKLSGASWGDGGDNYGFLDYASKESYPYVLADHLRTTYGYDVDLKNLSLEGMRTDELRGILDPEWGAAVPATKGQAGDGHYEVHMKWYNNFFNKNAAHFGTNSITDYFTGEIASADVVTVDLTMNNFGVYLSNRFLAMTTGSGECGDFSRYSEDVEDIADELDFDVAAVKNVVEDLVSKLLPADGDIPGDLVNGLIDTLVYCYCDFRVNFRADIDLLLNIMKPDAKLIVVGAYNFMNGLKCDLGGIELDFGSVWGTMTALVNSFLTNTCKGADKYYYADCSKGIEMFVDNAAKAETPADIYRNFANRLIEDATGLSYDDAVSYLGQSKVDGILSGFSKAAAFTPLDFAGVLGTLGAGGDLQKIGEKALTDWDGADSGAKSIAHVYVRFMAGHGLGGHPDDVGCAQKADAVIAAYESNSVAKNDGMDSVADIGDNVFSAIWATLKTPVLDAIKGVFDTFANAMQEFLNFLFKPLTDFIDLLPFC